MPVRQDDDSTIDWIHIHRNGGTEDALGYPICPLASPGSR